MHVQVICMVHKLEKLVGNYKPKTYPLSCSGEIYLQVTIPWRFHPCQWIVGSIEQTLGLIRTQVLLRLWDAAQQV